MAKKTKTAWKDFRCNEAEAKELARCAEENKISESEYIRRKVFEPAGQRFPPSVNELLQELKHYNLKTGNNINQIVRSCNSKKFITRADYQMLVDYLEKVDGKYREVVEALKKIQGQGTDADAGKADA